MTTILINCSDREAAKILKSVFEKASNASYESDEKVIGEGIEADAEYGGGVLFTGCNVSEETLSNYLPKPLCKYFYETA